MSTVIIGALTGIAIGILCIISFLIGARTAQKILKKEEVIIPTPSKAIQEIIETKERQKEIEKNKIIAENIDNYDGTIYGQKDLPR